MPYNVDKDQGGDSKENTSWMENCVESVMSKSGKDKPSAIAICKAQMKKKQDASIDISNEVLSNFEEYRRKWIQKEMQSKRFTFQQASSHFEIYLALNNYIIDI